MFGIFKNKDWRDFVLKNINNFVADYIIYYKYILKTEGDVNNVEMSGVILLTSALILKHKLDIPNLNYAIFPISDENIKLTEKLWFARKNNVYNDEAQDIGAAIFVSFMIYIEQKLGIKKIDSKDFFDFLQKNELLNLVELELEAGVVGTPIKDFYSDVGYISQLRDYFQLMES